MKAPASLPIFGDAYLADTQHLTLEEHGAYFKLLLCAWRTSACELPADDKRIATMLGISAGKWAKLKPAILAFWTRTETGWQQKRLTKERAFVDEKRVKNSAAAGARWNDKPLETKEGSNANAYATAMPLSPTHLTQEETIAGAMDGKPSEAPDDVDPIDLKALLFSTGKPYLIRNGVTPANAGSILGKWRQQHGDGAVIDALALAQAEACSAPIPFITKILERRNGNRPMDKSTDGKPVYRRSIGLEMLRELRDGIEADAGSQGGDSGTGLALPMPARH